MAAVVASVLCLLVPAAEAAIDLANAEISRLDNGLTVILLEDRNFPVASVQMLYRVGARNEQIGKTGLAHFLEHMAFRSSEHFPETDVVSSIYAVGGEWHGYTWIDQTTYFSTVPREHLDLLLRIEADRMSRLDLAPEWMEAERGAVLAELNMYQNYPTAVLLDGLLLTSFLTHPYRNNTIGWPADIERLRHEDVVDFYERHYHAGNAVLAVVGDFDADDVRARIAELFGPLEGGSPSTWPEDSEIEQDGLRRIRVHGSLGEKRIMIAYRAPSASHPDFAAFLLLQEWLATGSGVNFLQNDWGTPVAGDALLADARGDVTTWFPPSADDYVFVVGGVPAEDVSEAEFEASIEEGIARARRSVPDEATLERIVAEVREALTFDVVTTEDAAHQLAYFEGLDAIDTLLELPARIDTVTAEDLRRVAADWLAPDGRTIAWYEPVDAQQPVQAAARPPEIVVEPRGPQPVDRVPVPAAEVHVLEGGIPVLLRQSDASPTLHLAFAVPGTAYSGAAAGEPIDGYSAIEVTAPANALRQAIAEARAALAAVETAEPASAASDDPETRIGEIFAAYVNASPAGAPGIAAIALSGDVAADTALQAIATEFGELAPTAPGPRQVTGIEPGELVMNIGKPVAQAQLGYIVDAPGPRDPAHLAWRLLLYILSHDYEGRFGKEAISNRGLAYYVDSRYRSDGANGWITLSVGVDTAKLDPLKALLAEELERLEKDPPTSEEIDEAKAHLVGRAVSAAQSNDEITDSLLTDWLWFGELRSSAELEVALAGTDREHVLAAIPAFRRGLTIVVRQ